MTNKKWMGKILSLILVFAMVVQLFAGLGTVAEASDATMVTITGVGACDSNPDWPTINLVTDIAGPGAIWKYDNNAAFKYNNTDAIHPLGWVATNVLQLVTKGKTWASGDIIVFEKGMQFTVESVVYELASGYKLTCTGSSWTGEAIVETTSVTITGVGACDSNPDWPTINLVTDIAGPGAIWKYDNNAAFKYNNTDAIHPLGWVATNVLQLVTKGKTWASGDIIVFEKGMQFTVESVVYELASGYKLTCTGSSWTGEAIIETTPVTITGLRTESAVTLRSEGDGYLYQMYFDTDITVPAYYPGWDNAASILVNDTQNFTGDTTWDRANESGLSILYLQDIIAESTSVDTIKIVAGTRYSIGGTVYEIANDFVIYNYDGDLHTEPKQATKVTITGLGACDSNPDLPTINIVTDIAGPGAIWKYDNNATFKYNDADAIHPLGWVGVNVLQLVTNGKVWTSGDVIVFEKGMQFTVESVLYELAEGYKMTYDGSTWTGETIIETTPVTITGLRSESAVTLRDDSTYLYQMYFDTDITVPAYYPGWDNAASILVNGTEAYEGDTTWDRANENGLSILYLQDVIAESTSVDTIKIAAGTRYSIGGTVYEIQNDFVIYNYDGDLRDTKKVVATPVTITGLNAASGVSNHDDGNLLYGVYLKTNLSLDADWSNFDNSAKIYVNGENEYTGDACWGINGGVLYIQDVISKSVTVNSITIKAGTQYTIGGILYEIVNDYTVYVKNGVMSETMLYDITKTIDGTTTVETVSGDYTLPEISVDGYTALGWEVSGQLYKVGATLPALAEGYTIEAVCVEFSQINGAQVRLTTKNENEEIGGIRFVCKLEEGSKSEYISQMGILIMPTNYMTKGELNHENYPKQTEEYGTVKGYREFTLDNADMELETYAQDTAANGAKAYYLRGSIVNLYAYNYTRSYSARSFLKVSYVDGTTEYIYTDYNVANNARRICDIAKKMIETDSATYAPINNTKYPIVYEYAKVADTLTSFGYFGPSITYSSDGVYDVEATTTDIQDYADCGYKYLWLDHVAYHYHDRYGATTVEEESDYYNNPTHPTFNLQQTMKIANECGLEVIVYDLALRQLSECDIPLVNADESSRQMLGIWLEVLDENNTPTATQEFIGSAIDESQLSTSSLAAYDYMYTYTSNGETITAGVKNYVWQFASEADLKEYVAAKMSAYASEPNFYGVMLCDEPATGLYAQAALMTKVIKSLYPSAYVECCQYPYYDGISGNNHATLFATWKSNITSYLNTNIAADSLLVDFYPYLKKAESYIGGLITREGVRPYYIESLQFMSNLKNSMKASGREISMELAVQTYENDNYSNVTESMLNLQYHLALAFGMDKIADYTYSNDDDTSTTQTILSDSALAGYVTYANKNANYLKAHMTFFEYVATDVKTNSYDYIDVSSLTTTSFVGEVITSSVSSGNGILVNKFYNKYTDEYGYYIVNISESSSLDITLSANMTVYQDYTNYKNEPTTTNTLTLAAGEGAFVIAQ